MFTANFIPNPVAVQINVNNLGAGWVCEAVG